MDRARDPLLRHGLASVACGDGTISCAAVNRWTFKSRFVETMIPGTGDTAWRAPRDGAGLHGLRFHDLTYRPNQRDAVRRTHSSKLTITVT